jgi:hypothetical protein
MFSALTEAVMLFTCSLQSVRKMNASRGGHILLITFLIFKFTERLLMVFGVGDLYQQLLAEFNVGLYR